MENSKMSVGLAVVFLISVIGVSNADTVQRGKVLDFHADCLDVHDVDEGVLVGFLEGTAPDEDEFYHHIFCVAKKAKVISDDGTVNTSQFEIDMKDVIEPENMANVAAIIRKCLIQREDPFTTIKEASHCFMKENHNL